MKLGTVHYNVLQMDAMCSTGETVIIVLSIPCRELRRHGQWNGRLDPRLPEQNHSGFSSARSIWKANLVC